MKFINNVILFFKRLFNRGSSKTLLDSPAEKIKENNKNEFINSLKVDIGQNSKKKKIETLTCFGDGLGIQTKISY